MTKPDYEAVVAELNYWLFDKHKEENHGFSYWTSGNVYGIQFDEHHLWCSEFDERLWIEKEKDYEPFIPFIKREFNKYVDRLHKLKFRNVPKEPKIDGEE